LQPVYSRLRKAFKSFFALFFARGF
jgi:hypothetical protein